MKTYNHDLLKQNYSTNGPNCAKYLLPLLAVCYICVHAYYKQYYSMYAENVCINSFWINAYKKGHVRSPDMLSYAELPYIELYICIWK